MTYTLSLLFFRSISLARALTISKMMRFNPLTSLIACLLVSSPFSEAALTTSNDQIIFNGSPVKLKGLSWFGFNNRGTFFDGFWSKPDALRQDFATIIYRWQLLGFNTIRIPFSFVDLLELAPVTKFKSGCKIPTFVSKK